MTAKIIRPPLKPRITKLGNIGSRKRKGWSFVVDQHGWQVFFNGRYDHGGSESFADDNARLEFAGTLARKFGQMNEDGVMPWTCPGYHGDAVESDRQANCPVPGPYEVSLDDEAPRGPIRFRLRRAGTHNHVCNRIPNVQTAQLLKAAPSLLEAAQYALDNLEAAARERLIQCPKWLQVQLGESRKHLRRAIAEAKGAADA